MIDSDPDLELTPVDHESPNPIPWQGVVILLSFVAIVVALAALHIYGGE